MNSSWNPDRPPSKGATAYHNAVAYTSWHKDNINALIKIIKDKIKKNDVVVDFGAGTGSSAIYLLKYLKPIPKLLLVDNSPSWLGYAYEILHLKKNVEFFLLEKKKDRYMILNEVVGKNTINHVICANTAHLIPNIPEAFKGIYASLKDRGTFTFQSGNIIKTSKEEGILMIDDSINEVHDMGLKIIQTDDRFRTYRKNLDKRINEQIHQRKFVFPTPRPIEYYLDALKSVGFKNEKVSYERIKVSYKNWLNFLRVRRLQAGILPEVGGKDPTEQEEKDRDAIIVKSSNELFKKLKKENPHANSNSFTAEWTYVYAEK